MDIIYRHGNLLDAEEELILHGCNAQKVMGSGVAKAIRKKWPGAYDSYCMQDAITGLKMGMIIWYQTGDNSFVGNAITQDRYGRDNKRYVSYDAIDVVMEKVNSYALEKNIESVAMPLIGAGLGGGEWSIISSIITTRLVCVQPVVYMLDGNIEDF